MARSLKARGIRNYVILMGGEIAIQRKGKFGLERGGGGVNEALFHHADPPPAPAKGL
jgi:hypothetical protein